MIKWSCAKCGYSTGRRGSVVRHIDNPNIHDGDSEVISYGEYLAGVRSYLLPPPTYAYNTPPYVTPYRKQLKHSEIAPADIMIPIADLIGDDWREKFRTMFSNRIAQDGKPNAALFRVDDGSLVYINYYGYVCPTCFSIGVTSDQKAARAIEDGDHFCPPKFSNHSVPPDRVPLYLEKLRIQLGDLLFDVAKTIATDKKLVLVGHTTYTDFQKFYLSTNASSFRELERGVIFGGGRLRLDDSKLQDYFKFYANTNNTIDIQYNNQKFKYDLWLAMQLR